jgi:hypothetical protein
MRVSKVPFRPATVDRPAFTLTTVSAAVRKSREQTHVSGKLFMGTKGVARFRLRLGPQGLSGVRSRCSSGFDRAHSVLGVTWAVSNRC